MSVYRSAVNSAVKSERAGLGLAACWIHGPWRFPAGGRMSARRPGPRCEMLVNADICSTLRGRPAPHGQMLMTANDDL